MTYIGSERHKQNMLKARAKVPKLNCIYCNELRLKSSITKHEAGCYLNPINKRLCVVCDTPIKNLLVKKDGRKQITCSVGCANKHFRSGPNHGNWKGHYKPTCFHYHKKECVVCGENRIVAVHHLDENHENNDPANLIPLCPTHHCYWHSKHKHLIENIVLEYIKNWSGRQDLNLRTPPLQTEYSGQAELHPD